MVSWDAELTVTPAELCRAVPAIRAGDHRETGNGVGGRAREANRSAKSTFDPQLLTRAVPCDPAGQPGCRSGDACCVIGRDLQHDLRPPVLAADARRYTDALAAEENLGGPDFGLASYSVEAATPQTVAASPMWAGCVLGAEWCRLRCRHRANISDAQVALSASSARVNRRSYGRLCRWLEGDFAGPQPGRDGPT